MSIELLRQLPLFAGLSDDDLKWLYSQAEPVSTPAGELLIEEGSPGHAMYIILDGEFQVTKRSGPQEIALDVREPGAVIGEMSLLDHAPRSASVRALRDSHLLKIHDDAFHQLLSASPSAALIILETVTARLRQNESLLHQREKMAALGTLSAGLAHELNNPAAAARRASDQLRQALADWERATLELNACSFNPGQANTVHELRSEIVRRAAAPVVLDPIARSDRESDVQAWLEDRGIDQAWDLAPTLVSFGWDEAALSELAEDFSPTDHLPAISHWLAAGGAVYALLDEVGKSAERISEIVKSVKAYSYLDQAPVQEVDVHEGLENTLVILRHKLKQGVSVTRDYARDLPRIEAYASELNQVWTNIVDNAIDAMNGQGELALRTYAKDDSVVVEITDNGPGIPPKIQSRIFEPFFTTKPPGVGTGLGLNISYNIVQKHLGQIKVTSQPGATRFQVILPARLKR
jgi:signal transduction histidine kinase